MIDRRVVWIGALCLVVTFLASAISAQQTTAGDPITPEEIATAVAAVRADPNLGGVTTISMIRWIESGEKPRPKNFGWMRWITGLFAWFAQSARYLVWALVVVLVAWLAVYISRTIGNRQAANKAERFVAPTHVRDLDIRPESLPPNIGRAARALWDRGEHRAAWSLLYRGLLSRLTHVHRVPITDSTTEGDCLSLITGRVAPPTGAYTARLIDGWQGFVYGGALTAPDTVHALCDEFATALDRAVDSAMGRTP